MMFDFLKRKYDDGVIGENEIYVAVENGWITEEEKNLILTC